MDLIFRPEQGITFDGEPVYGTVSTLVDEDEAGTAEHVLLVAELTLMSTGKTIFFMESFAEHGDISHWLANEVAPALGQVH